MSNLKGIFLMILIMVTTYTTIKYVAIPYIEVIRADRANKTHKYEVWTVRNYRIGYTNTINTDKDGCLMISTGKACGSYYTVLNKYYKGE